MPNSPQIRIRLPPHLCPLADNVHLIIDQVRKALYADLTEAELNKCKMGTIINLVDNVMFRRLWEGDFHIVSCCEAGACMTLERCSRRACAPARGNTSHAYTGVWRRRRLPW